MQSTYAGNILKYCRDCNTDVSGTWRYKNHRGEYFCQTCHQKRQQKRATATVKTKPKYCVECKADVSRAWRIKNFLGEYFCQTCYLRISQMPVEHLMSAEEKLGKPSQKKTKAGRRRQQRSVMAICPAPNFPWAGMPFGRPENFYRPLRKK
jgi:hypothetical protein